MNSLHNQNSKQIARKMMIQWISLIKEIHSKKDEDLRGLMILNHSSVISLIKKKQWIKLHHQNTNSIGIQNSSFLKQAHVFIGQDVGFCL